MDKKYGKLLENTFAPYYERFRKLNAISPDTAVTKAELFPEGQSFLDPDRMHKLLSMEIVKRKGIDKYWLDEERAANPGAVLRQRILILIIALVLGTVLGLLKKNGII